jgi:hypothetical protein
MTEPTPAHIRLRMLVAVLALAAGVAAAVVAMSLVQSVLG